MARSLPALYLGSRATYGIATVNLAHPIELPMNPTVWAQMRVMPFATAVARPCPPPSRMFPPESTVATSSSEESQTKPPNLSPFKVATN